MAAVPARPLPPRRGVGLGTDVPMATWNSGVEGSRTLGKGLFTGVRRVSGIVVWQAARIKGGVSGCQDMIKSPCSGGRVSLRS